MDALVRGRAAMISALVFLGLMAQASAIIVPLRVLVLSTPGAEGAAPRGAAPRRARLGACLARPPPLEAVSARARAAQELHANTRFHRQSRRSAAPGGPCRSAPRRPASWLPRDHPLAPA
jgi:hypothetical protein